MILWELKLVIEFPPGSTILIPSSVVTHSNTPIQPGEMRYSFTQYTAGATIRWVDYGFQKVTDFFDQLSDQDLEAEKVKALQRLAMGLSLFSKVDEL